MSCWWRRRPPSAQVSFVGRLERAAITKISPTACPARSPATSAASRSTTRRACSATAGTSARHSVLEHQCAPYTLPYMFFGPNQFRIWEDAQPGHAGAHRHPDVPGHLPAAPDDLDGRAPAPAGVRAAHLHGLLDRRVERRHPDDHDHAHQGRLLPPQRRPGQRSHRRSSSTGCATATCCRR